MVPVDHLRVLESFKYFSVMLVCTSPAFDLEMKLIYAEEIWRSRFDVEYHKLANFHLFST